MLTSDESTTRVKQTKFSIALTETKCHCLSSFYKLSRKIAQKKISKVDLRELIQVLVSKKNGQRREQMYLSQYG